MNQDFECPRCGHCCKTDLARVGEVGVWGEWVGLTDDECIESLPVMPYEYEFNVQALLEYTKNVEAKLKEKNT